MKSEREECVARWLAGNDERRLRLGGGVEESKGSSRSALWTGLVTNLGREIFWEMVGM